MSEPEGFAIVPRRFLDFLRHAPVGSGTCCCGAEMEGHGPYDNHAPCDMWDHNLGGWLKSIEAAPVTVTDEMIEVFGMAYFHVNAASKIDLNREDIREGLAAAIKQLVAL